MLLQPWVSVGCWLTCVALGRAGPTGLLGVGLVTQVREIHNFLGELLVWECGCPRAMGLGSALG